MPLIVMASDPHERNDMQDKLIIPDVASALALLSYGVRAAHPGYNAEHNRNCAIMHIDCSLCTKVHK
jgi:hypothetical protein